MDGQEVTGTGRTKKHAKQAVAEAALRTIIQVMQYANRYNKQITSLINKLDCLASLKFPN